MIVETKNNIKNTIEAQLLKNGKKNTAEKICYKSIKTMQSKINKPTGIVFKLAVTNTTQLYKIHRFEQKKGKRKKIKEVPGFILLKSGRNSLAVKKIVLETKKSATNKFFLAFEKTVTTQAKNITESALNSQRSDLNKQAQKYNNLFKYFKLH